MKSSIVALAAGLAATATAAANPDYKFLDIVPLEARQDVSPEKYACHENCGTVILVGKEDGAAQCNDANFTEMFNECMSCALEFDIWQHYGDGVTEAAEECNLEIDLEAAPSGSLGDSPSAAGTGEAPAATASSTEEEEAAESAGGDDDSAASSMTSSAGMMLFAMIAAAGLM